MGKPAGAGAIGCYASEPGLSGERKHSLCYSPMTNAMAIVNIEILAGLRHESPYYIASNRKRS